MANVLRGDPSFPGTAWTERANELVEWAWLRLVNRLDAWGGYRTPEEWGREYTRHDGSKGKLGRTTTLKGVLTRGVLVRHFRTRGRGDVIGLHSTSPTNICRWGAVDVDHHGPTGTAPDINLRAALAWYDRLVAAGFKPLLLDSNGQGGFHLFLLLAEPVPTPRVFAFLQRLTRDHARHGMMRPPEQFPKQPVLPVKDGKPQFGNWLRAPGRHHTREHWSRVWDGDCWLEGHKAVDFMLALNGDPVELLPEAPPRPAPAPRPRFCQPTGELDNRAVRAASYLARVPNAGEGQGRTDLAYRAACFLARDLGLTDDVALDWLQRWDAGNNPPLREKLLEILGCARSYGRYPIGAGLLPCRIRRDAHGHVVLSAAVEVWG